MMLFKQRADENGVSFMNQENRLSKKDGKLTVYVNRFDYVFQKLLLLLIWQEFRKL